MVLEHQGEEVLADISKFSELYDKVEFLKKENKLLQKKIKHTKNILFNFKQECYDQMLSFDHGLFLSNESFNKLFEKLINKFRKYKKGGKKQNGR